MLCFTNTQECKCASAKHHTKSLVHSFVISPLKYCNFLLSGLSLSNLGLIFIQNFAAQIIYLSCLHISHPTTGCHCSPASSTNSSFNLQSPPWFCSHFPHLPLCPLLSVHLCHHLLESQIASSLRKTMSFSLMSQTPETASLTYSMLPLFLTSNFTLMHLFQVAM